MANEIRDITILMDVIKLKVLAHREERTGRLSDAHDAVQQRLYENRIIDECKFMGQKVALVWSGRDCDGVRYSGDVRMIEPDRALIDKAINETYYWADGPCGYYMRHGDDVHGIEYQSRDLVMEAFENGHPHVIYG